MRDREDVSRQTDRVAEAVLELKSALADLSRVARLASKQPGRLLGVHAAHRQVVRAEEAVDIATMDLAAARGEDV